MTRDPIKGRAGAGPLGDAEFAALMDQCLGASASNRIAVGVSGGADSMALTLLADKWARARGIALTALTVDHGLRDQSAAEAATVAKWLRGRGISHKTLRVSEARPVSGLQKVARRWRMAAFDAWCRDHDAGPILLAHTAEDQAETLWLRMLADSGPDGLAAMRAETSVSGLRIARPLLTVSKARLMATCRFHGQDWIEDPSNRNLQFARVRLRDLAPDLDRQGLGTVQASRIIRGMSVARAAMDRHCANFMTDHGGVFAVGAAWFEGDMFATVPAVFGDLLLSRLTSAVGGRALPPRRGRVRGLADALRKAGTPVTRTLGGCVVSRRSDGRVWVFRELAACAIPMLLQPGRLTRWDRRFEVIWRGSRPLVLGPLREDGWQWIKRNEPRTSAVHGLDVVPHAARLSIPAIRELDGSVIVPHFVSGDGVKCVTSEFPLAVGFCPDAEWIGSPFVPIERGLTIRKMPAGASDRSMK